MDTQFEDSKQYIEKLLKVPEYANSTILTKLKRQLAHNQFDGYTFALFIDIDSTYIYTVKPDEDECEGLTEDEIRNLTISKSSRYIESTEHLTEWLESQNIPIIGVTARDKETVQEGQPGGSEYNVEHLPFFDMIAASVGTEVWVGQKDHTYHRDMDFSYKMEKQKGFERDRVYEICKTVCHSITNGKFELDFQPRDSEENVLIYKADPLALQHHLTSELYPQRRKISLTYRGSEEDLMHVEFNLRKLLHENGLPQIKVLVSFGENTEDSFIYHIDIVPTTKKESINYLVDKLGCIGLFGGDSGNDIDAILRAGHAGFVVAGSTKELQLALKNSIGGYNPEVDEFQRVTVQPNAHFEKRLLYLDSDRKRRGPESAFVCISKFVEYLNSKNEYGIESRNESVRV